MSTGPQGQEELRLVLMARKRAWDMLARHSRTISRSLDQFGDDHLAKRGLLLRRGIPEPAVNKAMDILYAFNCDELGSGVGGAGACCDSAAPLQRGSVMRKA